MEIILLITSCVVVLVLIPTYEVSVHRYNACNLHLLCVYLTLTFNFFVLNVQLSST